MVLFFAFYSFMSFFYHTTRMACVGRRSVYICITTVSCTCTRWVNIADTYISTRSSLYPTTYDVSHSRQREEIAPDLLFSTLPSLERCFVYVQASAEKKNVYVAYSQWLILLTFAHGTDSCLAVPEILYSRDIFTCTVSVLGGFYISLCSCRKS